MERCLRTPTCLARKSTPDLPSQFVAHDSPPSTRTAWVVLSVLALAGFLALSVELSPAGVLTRMAPDLNTDVAAAGALMSLYALGNAVLVLPLTAWSLRFSRRAALTTTLLAFVAGNILVALSSDLTIALLGRFISGAAHGLLMALSPAVAIRLVGPEQRGRALALVIGANTVGIAIGAPLTSVIGTTFGWQVTFLSAAGLAAVCGIMLWLTVPAFRSDPGRQMSVLNALRLPGVLRIGVAWALVMLGHLGVITYIDPYLVALGAPALVVSGALFVFGTAGLVGVWVASRIARKSLTGALIAMPSIMAVALIAMAFRITDLGAILALLAVWGVGFAGVVLAYQQSLLHVGHRAPETVTSIGVVLCQAGMAAGAALGGIVVAAAGVTAIPMLGVAAVAAALLLLIGVGAVIRRASAQQETTHDERPVAPAATTTI